ncbi:MAG: hypothetical protein JXB62_22230 [Pirellulales bacterium]|nr:hypothetical protein [Pirellulales bacterium]
MWKTVGVSVLRCGAIYSVFGVLGIAFYLVKWSYPMLRRPEPQPDEPAGP